LYIYAPYILKNTLYSYNIPYKAYYYYFYSIIDHIIYIFLVLYIIKYIVSNILTIYIILNMNKSSIFDSLLEKVRVEYQEAKKHGSLADTASTLTPAENLGSVIRQQRKKQRLTLNDLCDLSEVSYTTLTRLEKGNPSVRLDILNKVLNSLGLKLWVG